MKNIRFHQWVIAVITVALFLLPFFWFKPGEMDLGGDSSRLYFYDPISYLKNYALYSISPSAFGAENVGYFMIPFVVFLALLKYFIISPTLLIALIHGINLSLAFLSCYGIVKELLKKREGKGPIAYEIAATIAGLLYIFSQTSIQGWDKVLTTHNQFFLNPLVFFLFLKYFKTDKTIYLGFIFIITFLFSPNFSFGAAPGFFAFYPLSLLFLLIYRLVILRKNIIWKHLIIGGLVLFLLHTFHILPQLISMFSPGSVLNTAIFTDAGKFDRGLSYFIAIAPNIKPSLSIMNLPQMMELTPASAVFIFFPIIITVGFLLNRKKVLPLTGIFFLIVLFFATANITTIGFELYKKMFSLPGFSIFRNFYGQWGYALLFFYTILFGQALAVILDKLGKVKMYLLTSGIVLVLLISGLPFINGSLVNKVLWQSKGMHIFMKMDPKYEELLSFVKQLPVDGKVLILPLTDPGYQIVAGVNNGAYQGPSTISYLAGKQDFAGYQELGKYGKVFSTVIETKNYEKFKELLGQLNIKYIVYNSDPRVYDTTFPTFPYIDVRLHLPKSQREYNKFLRALGLKEIKNIDNKYYVFEVTNDAYQPLIFAPEKQVFFNDTINDWSVPLSFSTKGTKTIYIESPQVPPQGTDMLAPLRNTSILTQIIKNPEPPHFLYYSFAKTPPSSIFYKPSVIKEYRDLTKQKDKYHYIDNRMFLSAKLLYELELWGSDMQLSDKPLSTDEFFQEMTRIDPNRSLWWELQHANNNWESLLDRYVRNYTESIAYLRNTTDDPQWVKQQKFLLNEYIISHKQRFNNLISGMKKSDAEKVKLTKITDNTFNYLLKELDLPDLQQEKNEYQIPSIEQKDTSVSLYVKKSDFEQFDQSQFGLQIGGRELITSSDQDEKEWVKLDTKVIDFSEPQQIEVVTKNANNLFNSASVVSVKPSDIGKPLDHFVLQNGLVLKAANWKPDGYYLLSFEYINKGAPYAVKLFEESQGDHKSDDAKQLLSNEVHSTIWTKYQAVVRSGSNADTAFVQIERNSNNFSLSEMEIKNISLTYVPQPNLFIKTTQNIVKETVLPKISFTKINPTRYVVTVKNSKEPYYLVLNQAYNNRWKLYLNIDFSVVDMFRSKPLFESSHYSVNGGMNAWYIDPKILGDKDSYSFVLDFTTQRYFYIGFGISLLTFGLIVFYTLYLLLKHEK